MNVRLSGLNELVVDLGELGYRATRAAMQAVTKACADTVRDAQTFAPVDTGNLRASIGADVRGLHGVVGPAAAYGRYVEEGTSRMAPHAYLGPAFDRNAPNFVSALEQITRLL